MSEIIWERGGGIIWKTTLIAETTGKSSNRWAIDGETVLAFGMNWGVGTGPLITTHQGTPLANLGKPLTSRDIRPGQEDKSDREIEIHHELDGLLRGFGTRFWQCIRDHHPATHSLLNNQSEQLISLEYKDRYLFTPLSISVLAEVIKGLRDAVGVERWALRNFEIETTNCRTTGEYRPRNKVWAVLFSRLSPRPVPRLSLTLHEAVSRIAPSVE